MIFESRVHGIPCKINVTYVTPVMPATHDDPECGGDFEFEVLTMKGKRALWLEKYLTEEDNERIFTEWESHMA